MTLFEFAIALSILVALCALRFGIPLLVIWLGKFVCCRVLHLEV